MANNEQNKVPTAKDLVRMFRQLDEQITELVAKVGKKLSSVWTRIRSMLRNSDRQFSMDIIESFTVDTEEKLQQMAQLVGTELSGSLYTLQKELDGLKVALIQAAAPLVQVMLPLLHQAVGALTGFASAIAQVMQSLFGGSQAADSYAQSAKNALASTQALKRSLAGFDQIQRLQKANSDLGFTAPDISISRAWRAFAENILKFLEPLKQIDLQPAIEGLNKLKLALEPFTAAIFEGLHWAWDNIFVPLAQWTAEKLLPTFLEALSQTLSALNQVIEAVKPAFTWLWDNFLEPIAQWYAEELISDIQGMAENFKLFAAWITESSPKLNSFLKFLSDAGIHMGQLNTESNNLTDIAQSAGGAMAFFGSSAQTVGPSLAGLLTTILSMISAVGGLGGSWTEAQGAATTAWDNILKAWGGAPDWFKDQVGDPMQSNAKSAANGMIGIFNSMLTGVSGTFNLLAALLSTLKIKFPDWVPILGGKTLSFNLPSVSVPPIPQLAQGAVLPANKPFLAMVGDQKHGTNVEAPLSTIQEAVALVLEDRLDGIMAGFEAVTQRQEKILQAIFGLDISDGALASAVARHQDKMLVVTGVGV